MRWIDDAVQKGRDVAMGTEILLPVKTMRETVTKQQEQITKRQRESKLKCIVKDHHELHPNTIQRCPCFAIENWVVL